MKFQRVEVTNQELNDLLDFCCPICDGVLEGHHVNGEEGDFRGYQRCPDCMMEFAWIYNDDFICFSREVQ